MNHRYFEFSSRITRGYGFLEERLKGYLQERVSRGKVDVYVSIETLEDADAQVQVNHSLAADMSMRCMNWRSAITCGMISR